MSNSPFLYPNVTSLPGNRSVDGIESKQPLKKEGQVSEFDRVLEALPGVDLNQVREPLKFSAHATQRLRDRKIQLNPETMSRLNEAVDRAAAKGVEDSLILTDQAALIVSVKNRTVVTAMDRKSMAGNVFTNIDGAIII